MEKEELTFEKILDRMRNRALKEIIEEKVKAMGFSETEVERYFANSKELMEVVKKY